MNLLILQDTDVTSLRVGVKKKKKNRKWNSSLSSSHNAVSDCNRCKSIHNKVKQFVWLQLTLFIYKVVSDDLICQSLEPWSENCWSLFCRLCLFGDLLYFLYFLNWEIYFHSLRSKRAETDLIKSFCLIVHTYILKYVVPSLETSSEHFSWSASVLVLQTDTWNVA